MVTLPTFATRPTDIAAVSCVELTNVVGSAAPFHCTCAPETKPVPLTASVRPALPTTTAAGLSVAIAGPALMGNVTAADDVPPEFTRIFALPAVAIRLAGIYAVNCNAPAKVVGAACHSTAHSRSA